MAKKKNYSAAIKFPPVVVPPALEIPSLILEVVCFLLKGYVPICPMPAATLPPSNDPLNAIPYIIR